LNSSPATTLPPVKPAIMPTPDSPETMPTRFSGTRSATVVDRGACMKLRETWPTVQNTVSSAMVEE